MVMRRLMLANSVQPSPSVNLIYELSEPNNTASFNTEIQLLSELTDFTILCEATFNNYLWQNAQKIYCVGTSSATVFALGRVTNCQDYRSGVLLETANRYTAGTMNGSSGRKGTSLLSRTNATQTRRFAQRFNSTTLLFENWCDTISLPTDRYYTVTNPATTDSYLYLNAGNSGSTVNKLKIYRGLLTDAEIERFVYNS